MKKLFLGAALLLVCSYGSSVCSVTAQIQEEGHENTLKKQEKSLKWKVAIGRFSNETQYGKGIFYNRENDPMAKQALDILTTKLTASEKFILLERSDMDKIQGEIEKGNISHKIGADYLILGSITQFGRKVTGKDGVFSNEKSQTVEAGVSIRIVDVSTGMVIYSEEGKGYAETTAKTTLGFGGKAGYDATLGDKAISGAIDQLVENIINKCTDKPWKTYLISADAEAIVIAGGASQGLKVNDKFDVYTRGKKVKNPQTGVEFELPGKKVATIRVEMVAGDTPTTEFSIVTIVDGSFDFNSLDKYYVQEQGK
ncbi:MAG: CsgG/HfaB family protein [Porphyromonas sp.]|nr:CsgG/HfaB family protein [Porphyromonas sp.]